MSANSTLALAGVSHKALMRHLFPGDSLEAAALLICSRGPGPRRRLLVRDVLAIPHLECEREQHWINWPGRYLEDAIELASVHSESIIAIHSHPFGNLEFSMADDKSDAIVMPSLFHGIETEHGSAIITADGRIRARTYSPRMLSTNIDLVTVAGDEIQFWWKDILKGPVLPFSSAMTTDLSRQVACVIGVSGTGSVVAEQLSRLGFGVVILIDYDKIEIKNLNRILNSTKKDAELHSSKVEMFARAIESHRGQGVGHPVDASILSRDAVLAASQSDVLFCCVDTLEARRIADLIAAAFLLPLIDVGVSIPVRKTNVGVSIADVCGRIDYVQPGSSRLQDRGVYTPESLRAEYLRRVDPKSFQQEADAGYIRGIQDEAPAVISLNMAAAAMAVNEYIARVYPYRVDANERYARTIFSLKNREEDCYPESHFTATQEELGRGDLEPLLGIPALAKAST